MSRPMLKITARENERATAWTIAMPMINEMKNVTPLSVRSCSMTSTARFKKYGMIIASVAVISRQTRPNAYRHL